MRPQLINLPLFEQEFLMKKKKEAMGYLDQGNKAEAHSWNFSQEMPGLVNKFKLIIKSKLYIMIV